MVFNRYVVLLLHVVQPLRLPGTTIAWCHTATRYHVKVPRMHCRNMVCNRYALLLRDVQPLCLTVA